MKKVIPLKRKYTLQLSEETDYKQDSFYLIPSWSMQCFSALFINDYGTRLLQSSLYGEAFSQLHFETILTVHS